MKKIKNMIGGSLVAAATTFNAVGAFAADENWKMHAVWVETRPEAQAFEKFTQIVSEKAGDKLDIQFFPGAALGIKDADMLRILPRANAIQASALYPGYMSRDKPEYAFTMPPGVASSPEQLAAALPDLRKIYGATYEEAGIELLGFVGHPVSKTYMLCKDPVNSLEDLRKQKVRVWEQFQIDNFAKLGVSAQIIGQNELYVAMQTGVVDCSVFALGAAMTLSLQEVAPYAAYLHPYVLHPLNNLVAKKSMDSLDPETQQIVRDAAKEIEDETFAIYLSGENDAKAETDWVALGGTVMEPYSEEDRTAFTDAARAVWEEESMGGSEVAQSNYTILSAKMLD